MRPPASSSVSARLLRTPSVDDELVGGRINLGEVERHQEVVHADRGDRAAQRIERHARVAQRESHLSRVNSALAATGMAC
jgi:hypothetical protein